MEASQADWLKLFYSYLPLFYSNVFNVCKKSLSDNLLFRDFKSNKFLPFYVVSDNLYFILVVDRLYFTQTFCTLEPFLTITRPD